MIFFALCALITALVTGLLLKSFPTTTRKKAFAAMVAFPLLLLGFYLYIGAPDLPSTFAKYEQDSVRTELRKLIHSEATLKIEALRDPENSKRWLKLGSLQLILDKNDDAVESLNKAFTLNPKDHNIRTALGAALLSQGIEAAQGEDIARAHKIFTRGLKIAPKNAPYYPNLKDGVQKTKPR